MVIFCLSETGSEKMNETRQPRVHVMGHDGRRLTLADLPPHKTTRWVVRRKAEVVAAVRGGLLSLEEVCSRYALNTDEFRSWEFCIDHYGIAGLRTTHTQFYFDGTRKPPRLRRIRLDVAILTQGGARPSDLRARRQGDADRKRLLQRCLQRRHRLYR
jgi:hypothetical protein